MPKKLDTYNDRQLAEMLQQDKRSSEAAFAEIYDRYSRKIYAYCMRIIGNKEQAEDIFQETFLKFYEHLDPKHENLNIQRFLIRIARNLCLNYKRNKKSMVSIDDFEYLVDPKGSDDDTELYELIKYAVELLDNEYREPLVLRVYNELSYEEISEMLDITVGNARIRVYRAKEKLKEILSPYLKDFEKNK